jgi:heterodisulfide reductase subunit A-like polyferredoxin
MKKSKFIIEFKDIPSPREKMPHIPLEERKQNFREVETGFDEAGALKEAKRCLSCRRCIGCGLCLAECDPKAVVYDQQGTTLRLKVNSVILAPGFDEFDAGRISELGYRKYPNVVTSIELERMLAPTGPYGGYVLRPYDGRVPEKIAFVQCVGSRNEAIGADFCSSICCMTAMKEALGLTRLIADSKVTILHRDMRPLGKGSEEFYQSVLKEKRIRLARGPVAKITEVAESRNLVVELAADSGGQGEGTQAGGLQPGPRTEEFDLVVLSVGVRAAGKALSRKTGVRLNKYSFCTTDSLNPGVTSKAGILSVGSFTGPMDIQSSVCQAGATAAVALRTLGQPAGAQGGAVASPSAGAAPAGGTSGPPVLVIGSGLAGLVAANELARMGHDVTVVEKEKDAGGTLSRYEFKLDEKSEKDVVTSLLETAKADPKIRILTSTELAKFSGDAGQFSVAFKSGGAAGVAKAGAAGPAEQFGAVVVCTGGREHVPDGLMHGKNARVMTQLEFGKALSSGEVAKTLRDAGGSASAAGAAATAGSTPSIIMIQCIGSRSSDWPVCSRVCCAQALRNALAVKKALPDAKVTIIHRDIRVYGLEEELLTEALEKGIELVGLKDSAALVPRGTSVEISSASGKTGGSPGSASPSQGAPTATPLAVAFQRENAAARETLPADYVVLSAGLRPSPESKALAEILGLEVDSNGFFKGLHPKLKPVETSRRGVYICGLAHSSQTVQETIVQAMAAAKKASSSLRGSQAN